MPYREIYAASIYNNIKSFNMAKDTRAANMAAFMEVLNSEGFAMGGRKEYSLGGDIGAGFVGATKGVAGSLLPGPLGTMANQGIDAIHGAIDNDITAQEKSIMGYGQAAGGIGTAIATGGASLATGADDIAGGLGQGISQGSKWGQKNAGTIDALSGLAGMAGGMAAGSGGEAGVPDLATMFGGAGGQSFALGGLQEYEGGGTHEENPNGGIPIGQNATVESGETALDMGDMSKFIFSDRLKEGKKSFAAQSKAINNKFKGREGDAAADRAKDALLKELATRQETMKAAKTATLQGKIDKIAGDTEQFANGGRAAKGFTLPQGLDASQVGAFQQYALQQDPDIFPKYGGTDQIFGAEAENAWGKYGDNFQAMQKDLASQGVNSTAVRQTPPLSSVKRSFDPSLGNPLVLAPGATGTGINNVDPNTSIGNNGIGNNPLASQRTAPAVDTANDSSLNRNLGIGLGALANSAGDIYGLAQGLRGPDNISLDRVDPNLINLERERQTARNQAATAQGIQRENVRSTAASSGQALSNLGAGTAAIDANLGNILSASEQREEVGNTQILNRADNTNVNLSNQEKQLNLQAEAKAQESIQQGLHGLGANTSQGIKDVRQSNAVDKKNTQQLNAINAILKNFTADASGNITFKDGTVIPKADLEQMANGLSKK